MKFGSPAITFVYHLGVHATDEDLLVRSLLKDGNLLQGRNVIVPRPRRYRTMVREHLQLYRGDPMPDEAQKAFFDALLQGYACERAVLSDPDYLTMPYNVFESQQLYSKAGFRTTWLRYLFPENPCEFFIGLRNPATFLPALLGLKGVPGYEALVKKTDPRRMRWPNMLERIQNNNPGCPITVWSNEDTPLIWPQLLREITATELSFRFQGDNDVLKEIVRPEGLEKLERYLEGRPPQSELQRRRVIAAFLDKYAMPEALEAEIDLPGWTGDLVDEVTALYEDDLYTIERMPGVNFISP
ncbi:MAG: hypothetical protein AAF748_05065 [Pseudomonadota bacterium]